MTDEPITTTHNTDRGRYEIHVGDVLAGVIDYRDTDGAIDMYHTGIESRFEGRGLGKRLAEFALTDARDAGQKVLPTCPFIDRFMTKNPDFNDLRA